ncbi:MAG: diguanylate phosphodiesterase [Hyphomicrobiales bacterium]|nr:diguanylate phosphodiesterase [Hyphomicrobiales bacterium]
MTTKCEGCRNGDAFMQPFEMAFQPIVNISTGATFAHEALVRGPNGESAYSVLSTLNDANRYAFDQQCRVKALETATELGLPATNAMLSINFMPNAVYEPRACIRLTLAAARRTGFPLDRIIFEFTEEEKLDTAHVLDILRTYREIGFKTAIDDFGAGYAGINLLAQFQPDLVKIDMALVRNIDTDPVKRTVLKHIARMMEDLSIAVICEGVETTGELEALRDLGVYLIQGYVLAQPAFRALPTPVLSPIA